MCDAVADFCAFYESNNFERSRRFSAGAYSTEPLRRALQQLGNPQNNIGRIFHVGGTVAKGSISHLLASYYHEQGETVGLYTSPHLLRLHERISVNGREISDREFAECFETLRNNVAAEQLSFFDALTAIGFLHFQKQSVSTAVIEVGLGGRLDSTNVVNPVAVFFGPVGMDHRNVLGSTIEEIAQEKAGIIKPGVKVFSMRQEDKVMHIFRQTAAQQGADIYFPDYSDSPDYRQQNREFVAAALAIFENKMINVKQISVIGRFEKLRSQPDIIFDTAHNAPGMKSLRELLTNEYGVTPRAIYFCCMAERDPVELLDALDPERTAEVIFPDVKIAGCHTPQVLERLTLNRGRFASEQETEKLLQRSGVVHVFCGTMQLYKWARMITNSLP